jgi:cytoplasmic iron level regulating protein YaaA (DUF328/UPF0246 family)
MSSAKERHLYQFFWCSVSEFASIECDSMSYLQDNLRIVDPSFMSSSTLVRMQPYRLEMATRNLFYGL